MTDKVLILEKYDPENPNQTDPFDMDIGIEIKPYVFSPYYCEVLELMPKGWKEIVKVAIHQNENEWTAYSISHNCEDVYGKHPARKLMSYPNRLSLIESLSEYFNYTHEDMYTDSQRYARYGIINRIAGAKAIKLMPSVSKRKAPLRVYRAVYSDSGHYDMIIKGNRYVWEKEKGYRLYVEIPGWTRKPEIGIYGENTTYTAIDIPSGQKLSVRATFDMAVQSALTVCFKVTEEEFWKEVEKVRDMITNAQPTLKPKNTEIPNFTGEQLSLIM